LQQDGVRTNQVTQVRGYADQMLRVKNNPTDPSNRRISILVKNDSDPVPELSAKDVVTGAAPLPGAPPKAAPPGAASADSAAKPPSTPEAKPAAAPATAPIAAAPAPAKPAAGKPASMAVLTDKLKGMMPWTKK
jgi:chemotaxis protein MotB